MADDAGRLNEVLAQTSFLYGGNADFVEDLHARWAVDPASVDPSWRAFFASLPDSAVGSRGPTWASPGSAAVEHVWPDAKSNETILHPQPAASRDEIRARTLDSLRAMMLIRAYRMRGHLKADLDPLGLAAAAGDASELDPASYGFSEADFD
ncbi:MAG: 2-oxoglutarate dehydrogenase E1 subunit family protein, partial [Caulobacteraceae bacterium]